MVKEHLVLKEFKSKNGKTVILRTPEKADLKAITNMINSIIDEDDYILLDTKITDMEAQQKWLDNKIAMNNDGSGIYVIAEVDGNVAGAAEISKLFGRASHTGSIGIAIASPFREDGIGTNLLDLLLSESRENLGIEIAKLEVYDKNTRAYNLYKKLGFKEFGTLPGEIKIKGEPHSAIYMYKELA